jgi:hypothetical protein
MSLQKAMNIDNEFYGTLENSNGLETYANSISFKGNLLKIFTKYNSPSN